MKEHFYSEWPIDYPVPIFDQRTDWHIVLYLKMSHKEIRSQSYKHIHDKEKLLYFLNVKTGREKRLE